MKLSTYIIIIFFVLLNDKAKAQPIDFELTTSKEVKYKLKDSTNGVKAIGLIGNNVYYHHYIRTANLATKKKNFVTKIDTNLNNIERILLDLSYKNKEMDFEAIEQINGKLYLFTSFQNKKIKKHFFFAQILDSKTLKRVGEIKVLGELTYNAFEKFKRTTFSYAVSEDKQKIMLYYSILSDDNIILRNELFVFSPELEFIWGYENAKFGEEDSEVALKGFQINNFGEVYILYADFKKEIKKNGDITIYVCQNGENKIGFNFKIYKLTQNSEEHEIYELRLPNKTIIKSNFSIIGDNLMFNGVYSDKNTYSETGVFLFNINFFTKEIKDIETADFGWDLIIQDLSEQELEQIEKLKNKDGEWDLYDYGISDIHSKSDGNKYFTVTQKQTGIAKTRTSTGPVFHSTNIICYKNNGIYVVQLNDKNRIYNIGKVAKIQYYLFTTFYQDEIELENNGNLYFIYNNIFQKKNKKGRTSEKTSDEVIQDHPVICTINDQAETKLMQYKEVPLKGFNSTRFIVPSSAIKLSNNTTIYQVVSKSGFSNYYEKVRIVE